MTYKVFESGETLTANDVMTYFMNQVVVQVDTEAELADLLADHADVRVAYAQDTDKVYAVVAGNWQELAYEGGDFTFDDLTVNGNLTVNGTTTNINSTNLVVEDKNIIIADVATPTDTTADGAGITIKGATDKTFNWVDSTDAFTASEHINLASGKEYKINGTTVLSSSQVLGKALPTGDVVGHTDSQTLTNKTISGSSNTLSNIPNNALTNSSITINGTPVSLGGSATTYSLPPQTGNSGKFLTTNGTTDSWGTLAAGGGMTLISTTSLSGATVTLSSIPQTYNILYLIIYSMTNITGNGKFYLNPNNAAPGVKLSGVDTGAAQTINGLFQDYTGRDRSDSNNGMLIQIHDYASTNRFKPVTWNGYHFATGSNSFSWGGCFDYNVAITSLVLSNTGGNFSNGTAYLYGVK